MRTETTKKENEMSRPTVSDVLLKTVTELAETMGTTVIEAITFAQAEAAKAGHDSTLDILSDLKWDLIEAGEVI